MTTAPTAELATGTLPKVAVSGRVLGFTAKYGTIVALGLMIAIFATLRPDAFFTTKNFINVLTQNSLIAIIACGMTLPLVVGEFDMSIGYQASFAGIISVGLMSNQHLPAWLAIAIGVGVGAAMGLINGLIITKLGVVSLIATLGTGTILVGMNYGYTGGQPVTLTGNPTFTRLSLGKTFGVIPNPILFMAVAVTILWILLNRTALGQQMQAVGGNPEAAQLSGVRVARVRIWSLVIVGIAATVTGVLLASRVGSGQLTAGDSYLMNSFAAVFLGSAALRDGEFHVIGTLIGVLTVGVGYNGLGILGAPPFAQYVFSGSLLILAVALSTVARRYAKR